MLTGAADPVKSIMMRLWRRSGRLYREDSTHQNPKTKGLPNSNLRKAPIIIAMRRIFLLSPAHSGGKRAALLTRPTATFELARQLQIGSATLGEVFAFCSGLYFRGKLAYARRFARPLGKRGGVHVITPSRGLMPADAFVDISLLHEFAQIDIAENDSRFVEPLVRSVKELAATPDQVVLLGSIATAKYVDALLPLLGDRLVFPADFVGRGDMSRGALMLRAAAGGVELPYLPVAGSVRRGRRAPGVHPKSK